MKKKTSAAGIPRASGERSSPTVTTGNYTKEVRRYFSSIKLLSILFLLYFFFMFFFSYDVCSFLSVCAWLGFPIGKRCQNANGAGLAGGGGEAFG